MVRLQPAFTLAFFGFVRAAVAKRQATLIGNELDLRRYVARRSYTPSHTPREFFFDPVCVLVTSIAPPRESTESHH